MLDGTVWDGCDLGLVSNQGPPASRKMNCNGLGWFWPCARVGEEEDGRIRYCVDGGKVGDVPDDRHGIKLRPKVTLRNLSLLWS